MINSKSLVLLDGGMGQELIGRGMTDGPLWSGQALLDDPDSVLAVHRDYVAAGADILITNSYALGRYRLDHLGQGDGFEKWNELAGRLARQAANESDREVLVAGCLPPQRGSYAPDRVAEYDVNLGEYATQVEILDPFVDLWIAETMSTIDESRAAADAARPTGKTVWVAYTLIGDDEGNIASGESLADAVAAVDADAYLLNCSDPERISAGLPKLLAATTKPVGAYANGFAKIPEGWSVIEGDPLPDARADLDPDHYAEIVAGWIDLGVTIIGGCCETGPAHIAKLAELS